MKALILLNKFRIHPLIQTNDMRLNKDTLDTNQPIPLYEQIDYINEKPMIQVLTYMTVSNNIYLKTISEP